MGAEYDASLELVKGRIKREKIDFATFPPVGDDVVLDSPKVVVVPSYK